MMSTIRKSLEILEPRERRLFYFLIIFSIMLGPVEVLGIASVMPFLAMVADQDLVTSNEYIREFYSFFGFQDSRSFIIALGLMVVGLLIVRTILFGFSVYANTRFAVMRNASIGHRLLRTYLTQNYTWFLNRHSADLAKTVLDEVKMVVAGILSPLIMLATQLSASIFVVGFVIVIEPIAALIVFAAFVLAYGSVYAIARRHLGKLGDERVIANQARFQVAHEALAGIKDLKVSQLEDVYARRFFAPAVRLAEIDVLRAIIAYAPNGATQIGAVSSIIAAVIYLVVFAEETLADVLPILGAFALAGYRLRPAVKDIYRTAVALRFNRPALDLVHRELNLESNQREPSQRHSAPRIGLERELELKGVGFTYPNAERPSVRDVSVTIPARATIGFVGSTGAGKTTVVDMVLGLLPVQHGKLLADGVPITQDNVQAWQQSIGYVSQHIFLADDTVAGNIAFGIPQHSIDMEAVERAARIAQLHDFVASSLRMGYRTEIGERGVRLSGGQRQRIGIARALYHDPDVLILDEATSALDNLTERAVIDAVHNLRNRKTIIMIAHRLTTVKDCSRIFLLEHGRLVDEGSYSELLERNSEFQSLVAAGG